MPDWIFGVACTLALIALGMPITYVMTLVGFFGIVSIIGFAPAMSMLGQVFFDNGMSYTLSVMPLFVLMGNLVVKAGLADELYTASNAWLRHYRGGLPMATVVACGGFSSVCGSSLATSATMARVSMPSMRRYGYPEGLAAGVIAAGGTLGILIPPSVILVLYGITAQQDIGRLFLAGVVPGILGILGYMIAVRVSLAFGRDKGERLTPLPLAERFRALKGVVGVLGLFLRRDGRDLSRCLHRDGGRGDRCGRGLPAGAPARTAAFLRAGRGFDGHGQNDDRDVLHPVRRVDVLQLRQSRRHARRSPGSGAGGRARIRSRS